MKKNNIAETYKGLSFSEASKKIEKKFPNAATDLIQKASMENELMQLVQHQEKVKTIDSMTKAVKEFKKGGMLPKYAPGGLLNGDPTKPDGLGQDEFNIMNPPVPPTLGSINPLDNPIIPQVNTLGTHNPVKLTVGERIGKAFSGLTSNPTVSGQTENREMSAYTPALIGQGISTAINAGILAGGYDKVAPVMNPNDSQVTNLMANRSIDNTQQTNSILSAYNAAGQNLSGARSINVRNTLDANLMGITQDSLAESNLNQQQINNSYKSDLAQTLNNLGQQKAQSQVYAEQLNNQSKSNWQGGVAELGKHLADIGLSQTTLKLNNVQQTAIANIMSQKYPDFMIGEEALKGYLNGTYTDAEFVKLKEAAARNPELQPVLDFATFQKQNKG
jgi:hypothetical protein